MDYLFMMPERQKPLVQRNNLNDKMNATIHLKIKVEEKLDKTEKLPLLNILNYFKM